MALPPRLAGRQVAGTLISVFLPACLAGSTDPIPPEGSPPPELVCEGPTVAPSPVRLLTRFEYANTVRDLLRLAEGDALVPAHGLPVENRALGFDNNAEIHAANPDAIRGYLNAADTIVHYVVPARLAELVPCEVARDGAAACGDAFLTRLLPRAFRRPIVEEEKAALLRFFQDTVASDDYETAVRLTLQVVLQSPQFLYRLEPGDPASAAALRPLSPFELASRLSYFIYGSMPDDELLLAATEGHLATADEVAAQARRMLADPKARRVIGHFHAQWLKLEQLDRLVKDSRTYPEYDDGLRASWRGAMEAYLADAILGSDGTLRSMFLSPVTFVDARLAALYGWPAPSGPGFHKVPLPRGYSGLLTQPALMAVLSLPEQSSPIRRGVFVREKIMCEKLDPPPANLAIMPPDPDPKLTTRERFYEHTANPFCSGCHRKIDPVGFGFEQLDAIGRLRTVENGKPVDASGQLLDSDDPALDGAFDGPAELSERLAGSEQTSDCMALQWFRFAMGREAGPLDACSLANAQRAFADSGGQIRELLVALTLTDAFQLRAIPEARP